MEYPVTLKKSKYLLKGIATYLPQWIPLPRHQVQFSGVGQRPSRDVKTAARAAYSMWMRLFIGASEQGVELSLEHVAELGPGDSLATGIAALLSGAERYTALDIVPTARNFDNQAIFEELVELFRARTPIPDANEIARHRPHLASYEFPKHLLPDELMDEYLAPRRLSRIRSSLKEFTDMISYEVPWYETATRPSLLFSIATMEHVDDPASVYRTIARLLLPGSFTMHVIDYSCHHTAPGWNAHYTYGPFSWRVVRGRCAYFINRWTHSMHRAEIKRYFDIVVDQRACREDGIKQVSGYSTEDLKTNSGFFIARRHVD